MAQKCANCSQWGTLHGAKLPRWQRCLKHNTLAHRDYVCEAWVRGRRDADTKLGPGEEIDINVLATYQSWIDRCDMEARTRLGLTDATVERVHNFHAEIEDEGRGK